ncbi:hypothetical protein T4E_6165 [Trichinella pseudospiralis]|uniref:Uncharacterized protein n=2 Tax=Trichinella pseudospiralis TaxID=6337 RepID=A0A0V0Y6X7_TRIPS|nr:hypothetical protein T4E_6165 [Trichinella pseudospiralis]
MISVVSIDWSYNWPNKINIEMQKKAVTIYRLCKHCQRSCTFQPFIYIWLFYFSHMLFLLKLQTMELTTGQEYKALLSEMPIHFLKIYNKEYDSQYFHCLLELYFKDRQHTSNLLFYHFVYCICECSKLNLNFKLCIWQGQSMHLMHKCFFVCIISCAE